MSTLQILLDRLEEAKAPKNVQKLPRGSEIKKSDYSNEPLDSGEDRDLGYAGVFLMDVEMDGGTVPKHLSKLLDGSKKISNAEKRMLIAYFRRYAPGDFS